MIKHYCDRCLKEIPPLDVCTIKAEIPDKDNLFENQRYMYFNLCAKCGKEFKEWAKGFAHGEEGV